MAPNVPTLRTRDANSQHGGLVPRITGPSRFLVSMADGEGSEWVAGEDLPIVAGAQGAQGAQGATGIAGGAGEQGAQGSQGKTGAQGAQGTQGVQGAQGFQGAQGTQGVQGATGSGGAQGAQGFQGVQGATGSGGAQGAQGTQGVQGAQGAQGAQGTQGATFASQAAGTLTGRAVGAGSGAPGELSVTQAQTILADGWAYVAFAGTVPATGLLRAPHASTILSVKESGGTDRAIVTWGVVGTNELQIGNTAGSAGNFVFTSTGVTAYDGSSALFTMGATVRSFRNIEFDSGNATPSITQVNVANAGTNHLSIQAQGSTGASNAGANTRIKGGKPGASGAAGKATLEGARSDGTTFDEGFAVDTSGSAARIGFYGATPAVKPAVTGSNGAQARASLNAELATLGLIQNAASGYLPYSSMCAARVTGQSGSTSEGSVAFDQADLIDTDAYHDPVTNNTRFVAPATGVYMIKCTMHDDAASSRTFNIRLRVDGTTYIASGESEGNLNAGGCVAECAAISLTAGTYVEVRRDAGGAYGSLDYSFLMVRLA
jgi:hypothetical protein